MTTTAPFETEHGDFDLFAEIMAPINLNLRVAVMPVSLEAFDREFNNNEIQTAAHAVLVTWIAVQLGQVDLSIPADSDLPCSDPSIADLFFPEWVNEMDRPEASAAELDRMNSEADIDAAYAKRACAPCQMRTLCLAQSLNANARYGKGAEIDFVGIAGGMGPGARKSVLAKFAAERRRYRNGRLDQQSEKSPETTAAMTADEIELLHEEARAAILLPRRIRV